MSRTVRFPVSVVPEMDAYTISRKTEISERLKTTFCLSVCERKVERTSRWRFFLGLPPSGEIQKDRKRFYYLEPGARANGWKRTTGRDV